MGARCLFATHYHQLSTDLRLDRPDVDQSADPVVARVHAAHMMAQAVPPNPHGINGGRGLHSSTFQLNLSRS